MRRYVLIDYSHLAHKCINLPALYATVKTEVGVQQVHTTIPNFTIKSVYNYSGKGLHYTGVFFEGGGQSKRKEYFAKEGIDYKGQRPQKKTAFYTGMELSTQLLVRGKVSCYRAEGYEADDLIVSMVKKIKSYDRETPIDVITNDGDLLPLVDEQVSVYIRAKRDYAEEGCPLRKGYYQVTPESWEDYIGYSSTYRSYNLPYNAMLLYKIIKGDKSDNIPAGVKGYGGVKFTNLINRMKEDGVQFEKVFRYGKDFDNEIKPVLDNYFKEEEVAEMKKIYKGIDMMQVGLKEPKILDLGLLQSALIPYSIHLVR